MGDNDFPNSNISEEDESPLLLAGERNGTETLDLSNLLTSNLTFSGSFDIRGDIWATTFGKLTQALPLPAFLIDQSCNIVVANQACRRISHEYEKILDTPFSETFPRSAHCPKSTSARRGGLRKQETKDRRGDNRDRERQDMGSDHSAIHQDYGKQIGSSAG